MLYVFHAQRPDGRFTVEDVRDCESTDAARMRARMLSRRLEGSVIRIFTGMEMVAQLAAVPGQAAA